MECAVRIQKLFVVAGHILSFFSVEGSQYVWLFQDLREKTQSFLKLMCMYTFMHSPTGFSPPLPFE